MLSKKGGRGFPYCILMDETGKVLKELRPSDEKTFVGGFKPVKLLTGARAAVAQNVKKKKQRKINEQNLALIEAVFSPKESDFKKLKKLAKKKSLNKEIRALYIAMVKTYPVRKIVEEGKAEFEKAGRDQGKRKRAEEARNEGLYTLFRKKKVRIMGEASEYFDDFWIGVANHAVIEKDKKGGLGAIALLEKKYADNKRALNYFKNIRRKLEALKR